MKRLCLIIFLIAICSLSWAGQGMGPGPGCKGYAAASECDGKLICQNFEGAGYDNSESWTGAGNYDADYTTTVLRGSQSLALWLSGNETSPTFTASDTVYFHFRVRFKDDTTPPAENVLFRVRNSTTILGKMALQTDGTYTCRQGTGTTVAGSTSPSANTDYHVWGQYSKSTGSNGIMKIYIGTDLNKPASADCSCTNGSETSQADNIYFVYSNTDANNVMVIDQILVKATEFTTVAN
jgi:hypothetical protein